jgi:integrase/recombinase XerD
MPADFWPCGRAASLRSSRPLVIKDVIGHSVKRGKTPVLASDEMRDLLESIPASSVRDLRDRALHHGLYLRAHRCRAFPQSGRLLRPEAARLAAAARKRRQGERDPLPSQPGKIFRRVPASVRDWNGREGPPFRAWRRGRLQRKNLNRSNVHKMIRRRARAAGIPTNLGCHSFRATGITNYLKNGGRLEVAQQMAGHESSRTTGLYDRRGDEISLDEVERISY